MTPYGATTAVEAPARAGWREWVGLAVLCLPTMLTTLDISVMFLALPRMSGDLGADATQQLWITDIYAFTMAGFLVMMGTLGDRIGRRKVLLFGAAAFVVTSVLAAYANSTGILIGARALLGVAGATVMPSVLALIRNMFRDPRQMSTAMSAWGSSVMLGLILGPVAGGLVLGAFWWGSIFLMAVPVMGLLLLVGPFVLPESRDPAAGKLDLTSVALSLVAILPPIYGFKELGRSGPELVPIAAILAGVFFFLVFVRRQRTLRNPLLDLSLFADRAVTAALLLALLSAFAMAGTSMMVSLYLQLVEGFSPVSIGLWMVIPSLGMIVAVNLAPLVARRIRPAYVLAAGSGIAAVGMVVLTVANGSGGLAAFLVGLVVVYFGVGSDGTLSPYLIMSSVPPEKAGAAGALSSTFNEFGAALGIAVLGLVGSTVYRTQVTVPAGVHDANAAESLPGAVSAAERYPADVADGLLDSGRAAFSSGLHVVTIVTAVLFAGLAVLAVVGLRRFPATGAPRESRV